MSADGAPPKKIAILGGGVGSLSVALALTEPGRGNYEVTVYQMGWRLGGKGASGRNPKYGDRIEEHGIHVWFGFYENAFKLLGSCYDTLRTRGWCTPKGKPGAAEMRRLGAGAGCFLSALRIRGERESRRRRLDEVGIARAAERHVAGRRDTRSAGNEPPLSPSSRRCSRPSSKSARKGSTNRCHPRSRTSHEDDDERKFRKIVSEGRGTKESALGPEDYLEFALDALAAPGVDDLIAGNFEGLGGGNTLFRFRLKFFAWALRLARTALKPWSRVSPKAHRLYLACDTFASITVGLSRDVFKNDALTDNLNELDELDLREWLVKHGSDPDTVLANPTVRFVYNSAFAFRDGDPAKPLVATGSALRGILRLFLTYKGAFAYRMASGMGDVVFSPIYETLRARGVRFKFFHRVDALEVGDSAGQPVIERIRMTEQARTIEGEYHPFVWVNDFPCWPSEPNFDELVDGAMLRETGVNLENPTSTWPGATREPLVLERGEHFDEVVLGIPVGALGALTESLSKHPTVGPRWSEMLAKIETTPTQAFQLWFAQACATSGWKESAPTSARTRTRSTRTST